MSLDLKEGKDSHEVSKLRLAPTNSITKGLTMKKNIIKALKVLRFMLILVVGFYVITLTRGDRQPVTHLSDGEISELIYEQSIPTPWR